MLFTRFKHSFRLLLLLLSTLIIVSCGSGDGESSVSDTPLTGLLLNGPVKGVTYSSQTQAGITRLGGEFKYFPNETIVFSIGGIKLGQVTLLKPSASGARAIVTPVELTGSTDASDPRVVRLLQFLQSLDRDGDHSNGILISPATAAAAASIFLDFSDPDFDRNNPTFSLQALVDQIAAPADPTPEIVSAAVALQNFGNTIRDNNLDISLSPTFQLVWSDEFNATTLNTDDWNFETGYGDGPGEPGAGWGNDEWQLYTQNSENLSIVFGEESDPANGYLRISALCPSAPSCGKRTGEITSAKINTKDKQEFQFGRIEARIKVPTGKGAWPAFWSLGAAYPETPWPAAGEIDFMEVFSVDNETTKDGLFTIHWEETDGEGDRQFTTSSKSFDGSSFHIFEAEWSNDRIIGRIDRVEFANYPIDPATQSELLNPFYLILNVAMGGNPVPGLEPDATTTWPQDMLVDYIRVYQTVAGLNNDILNINFEDGPSKFVCFEAGAGCGGATGFAGGDASIQPNPETAGINPSANAGRFLKFNPGNGEAFGGTLVRLTDGALDFPASNEIFTMKVYSTRAVPVLFELADSTPNDGGIGVTAQHTGGGWEELEFDFTGLTAGAARTDQIVLIFDNGVVGDAEGDPDEWTFYFDDIVLQKLPPVTGGGLGATDGDFGDGSSDGTGFGVFSETNTTTAVSNANIVSAGNTVGIDGASAAVTPFEGSTVLALTYSDNTEGSNFGGGVIEFDSADVSAFNTLKFTIDAASFRDLASLTVQLEPPGGGVEGTNVNLASYTPVAVLGNWKTYEIPLADFSAVDPASITKLGFFNARDGSDVLLAGTLYLDDIHFTSTSGGGGTGGGPEWTTNGTFEAGDTSGWTLDAQNGTFSATMDNAATGSWSGNLVATGAGSFPTASQANLAIGTVTPNQSVTVSFDYCGELTGAGGVFSAQLLSEVGGGSPASKTDGMNGVITSLPATWTQYSFTGTTGSDVTAGVTLQLKSDCGGNAGCVVDAYIDNVSVTFDGEAGGNASNAGAACTFGGGGGDPVPVGDGNELLTNGDFEASPTDKAPWTNAGTVTTNNFYTVVANDGGNVFDTNLSQTVALTNGVDYVLKFRARASVERDIVVGIGDAGSPFAASLVTPAPTLTTDWQSFSFPLTASNDGGAASRVLFDLGTVASTVEIDDVSLELASDPGVNLLTNGDFEASPTDKAPWTNAGTVTTNNFYTVVANDGGNVFDTNLSQTVALTNGVEYVLSYRARASVQRDIVVGIGDAGSPFVATLVTPAPTLTTEWQTFTHALTASNDGGAASRVLFDLGTVASTVDIDDVSLQVIDTGDEPPPVGDGNELLTNGDFEASPTDKAPWTNAGTVTTNNFYTVVANDGGNVFDTNLSQTVALTNGVDYVLKFRARASVERDIVVGIGDAGSPFAASLVTPAPTLTTDWQSFSFPLTASNDGGAASRVLFDLGTVASTVEIDDVSLELASDPGVNLLTNGDFEASPTDKAPWTNAGTVTTNNFYTVVANDGGNVFDTNLSQTVALTNGVEYVLSYRARASVQRDIVVGIGDAGSPFVATLVTPAPTLTTEWQTFTHALTASNDGGAASRVLFDLGTVASTVDIDDVSLQVRGTGGGGGGTAALVNGDFETGDFTGWTQVPDAGTNVTPGTISLVTTALGGRTSAVARLEAAGDAVAGSQDVLLTQTVASGTLNVGDTIDVSFDLFGSLAGAGGVVFVELIYLDGTGTDTGTRSFVGGGAPKVPTTTWTTYPDSIVVPSIPDVSGGVVVQLKSSCGPVDGCAVDAYFDNVLVTITP